MSFFELPAWQPPSGYWIPAWLRPPQGIIPGIVPVELLLAHSDTHAVLVTGLHAYPTGLDFVLAARRRPGQPASTTATPSGTTSSSTACGWSCASPTAAQ